MARIAILGKAVVESSPKPRVCSLSYSIQYHAVLAPEPAWNYDDYDKHKPTSQYKLCGCKWHFLKISISCNTSWHIDCEMYKHKTRILLKLLELEIKQNILYLHHPGHFPYHILSTLSFTYVVLAVLIQTSDSRVKIPNWHQTRTEISVMHSALSRNEYVFEYEPHVTACLGALRYVIASTPVLLRICIPVQTSSQLGWVGGGTDEEVQLRGDVFWYCGSAPVGQVCAK